MKKTFVTLGMALASALAFAQEHTHSYDKSVFYGWEDVRTINTAHFEKIRTAAKAHFPGWYLDIDKLSGQFTELYGDAIPVAGNTNYQRSQFVMDDQLDDLNINKAEWVKVRDASTPKAAYVDYEQYFNGHKVLFSRLSFRFTNDGKLVRIKNKSFGTPQSSSEPMLTPQEIKQSNLIAGDIPGASISNIDVSNDWVWFPVPVANGYKLVSAREFTAEGTNGESIPLLLTGFVDATTGEVLYRTNEVKDFDVQVKGVVFKQNTVTPATLEPLGNLEITINGLNYNVNDTGFFSDPAGSANIEFKLKGKWSTVVDETFGTPSATSAITGTGNVYTYPTAAPSSSEAVNAYYHVNRVHDFMKAYMPSFTGMDISLTTNVNLTTGSCNAFYTAQNGQSINFYAPTGCPSFAQIGDIVYHEYGHAINRNFYNSQGASSMRNGALNEGSADVWGMSISKDSVLGRNSMGSPGTFIRRYDQNHKVYPEDIQGEVHADGEIIAGAWWDFARNTGSYETMTEVFTATYNDLPDGPNGMEGPVYHDVLISAILNDDDDATLSNGTPHLNELVTAFAKHGIYLYANAVLNHQELVHQQPNTPITVNTSLTISNPDFFQNLVLHYRNRSVGTWDSVVMTNTGSFNFTAQIPAQPAGSIIDYFFYIHDVLQIPTVSFPHHYSNKVVQSEVTIPYQFAVGISPRTHISFEEDVLDWEVGLATDNATSGNWIQAKPIATLYTPNSGAFGQFITQVGADHTSGSGKCLVTANGSSYSNADVDNGRTTVQTPLFDVSGYVYPMIEYYRWFSNDRTGPSAENDRRNDNWKVDLRTSANGFFLTSVENTFQSDYNWRRRIFALDEFFPGQRTFQLRFTAVDNGDQSIVEAAIDDFFIYDGVPTSVGNVSGPAKATVYPNPADKLVIVELPQPANGTIGIYDMNGKMVASKQMQLSSARYELDTRGLAAGQYFIVIQTDNKTIQSQKLTVTHR